MPALPEIPIEDFYEDILGKAQRGLGFTPASLAEKAGVPEETLRAMLDGHYDAGATEKVAPLLGLSASRLAAAAAKSWRPAPVELDGLAMANTAYGDMFVNAYLVWDPASKQAAVFDTGTDTTPLLDTVRALGLEVTHVFITHTHGDHIADLDNLLAATGNPPVFANRAEPVPGATLFDEGQSFSVGALAVETRTTSGHSVGGTTFVVTGLDRPVAVVGDAVFAGSMGGGAVSFPEALANNREKILTLPGDTVLCPGHGPVTTVAGELEHNPFFI